MASSQMVLALAKSVYGFDTKEQERQLTLFASKSSCFWWGSLALGAASLMRLAINGSAGVTGGILLPLLMAALGMAELGQLMHLVEPLSCATILLAVGLHVLCASGPVALSAAHMLLACAELALLASFVQVRFRVALIPILLAFLPCWYLAAGRGISHPLAYTAIVQLCCLVPVLVQDVLNRNRCCCDVQKASLLRCTQPDAAASKQAESVPPGGTADGSMPCSADTLPSAKSVGISPSGLAVAHKLVTLPLHADNHMLLSLENWDRVPLNLKQRGSPTSDLQRVLRSLSQRCPDDPHAMWQSAAGVDAANNLLPDPFVGDCGERNTCSTHGKAREEQILTRDSSVSMSTYTQIGSTRGCSNDSSGLFDDVRDNDCVDAAKQGLEEPSVAEEALTAIRHSCLGTYKKCDAIHTPFAVQGSYMFMSPGMAMSLEAIRRSLCSVAAEHQVVHLILPWLDPSDLPESTLSSVAQGLVSRHPGLSVRHSIMRRGSVIISLDVFSFNNGRGTGDIPLLAILSAIPSAEWLEWMDIPLPKLGATMIVQVGHQRHEVQWNAFAKHWQAGAPCPSPRPTPPARFTPSSAPLALRLPDEHDLLFSCFQSLPTISQGMSSEACMVLGPGCRASDVPGRQVRDEHVYDGVAKLQCAAAAAAAALPCFSMSLESPLLLMPDCDTGSAQDRVHSCCQFVVTLAAGCTLVPLHERSFDDDTATVLRAWCQGRQVPLTYEREAVTCTGETWLVDFDLFATRVAVLMLEAWRGHMMVHSARVLCLPASLSAVAVELELSVESAQPLVADLSVLPAPTSGSRVSEWVDNLGMWLQYVAELPLTEPDVPNAEGLQEQMCALGMRLLSTAIIEGCTSTSELLVAGLTDASALGLSFKTICRGTEGGLGNSPLHLAVLSRQARMVAAVLRMALEHGCPLSWEVENDAGATPLHLLAYTDPDGTLFMALICTHQAAHTAWHSCQGGLHVTPSQVAWHLAQISGPPSPLDATGAVAGNTLPTSAASTLTTPTLTTPTVSTPALTSPTLTAPDSPPVALSSPPMSKWRIGTTAAAAAAAAAPSAATAVFSSDAVVAVPPLPDLSWSQLLRFVAQGYPEKDVEAKFVLFKNRHFLSNLEFNCALRLFVNTAMAFRMIWTLRFISSAYVMLLTVPILFTLRALTKDSMHVHMEASQASWMLARALVQALAVWESVADVAFSFALVLDQLGSSLGEPVKVRTAACLQILTCTTHVVLFGACNIPNCLVKSICLHLTVLTVRTLNEARLRHLFANKEK